MGTTTDKLNKLIQTKAAIKAALEEKGQNPSDVFSTYADNIKAIKDIPILDGTALPDNVLKGKTFYSDNPNEKLTGNIETFIPQNEYTSNQTLETSGKYLSGDIIINTPVKKDEQTKTVELNMSTGNQVITPDSNKVLTEVTINKPDTFIESNIKTGISIGGITGTFTSDADAVANDIIKGKTAYVKGEQITGTIETFTPSKVTSNGTLQTSGKYVDADIVVEVPSPTLDGNAEASNVLNGKTFYSDSTTKQTGTMYNVGQDIGTINNTEHPRYNIAEGYHNGTGYVQINPSEIIDCVAANILQGKRVLGVIGTLVKGITPTGKKTITDTNEIDVTNFATAQVVDSNLVAGNIKKGVSILGITGTFEATLPTLNAPTISLSGSTLTITNPVTNGSFVSEYDVYKNGILLTSITLATVDLSTLITDSGTYTITVKAKGTNFNESVASNSVTYTVSSGFEVSVNISSSTFNANKFTFYDGQNSSALLLGTLSFGQSQTFIVASGYLYMSTTNEGSNVRNTGQLSGGVTLVEDGSMYAKYKITGNGSISGIDYYPCFVEGTLITMANGTQKPVENIEYGDEVLCYDFEKGKQTTSYIDWMIPKQTATEYWKITLSDSTILKLVGPKDGPNKDKSHRLYNVTKQSFMYPQDFEKDDLTLKENGDLVKVVSCEKIFETVNFYNIASNKHINVYAENVLTSNRLNNIFEIKNNKFTDKKLMTDEEIKAYKEHMERLKK